MSTQNSLADYPPIFIGGLPSSCDWQSVYNYLQQFGEIKSLLVPRYKRTGRIKGYAKARFAKQESLDIVLAEPQHIIGGLRVGIFLWKSKAEYAPVMDELRARMVHVKYEFEFSEKQLREYFTRFGPVQLIEMPYNPITKELRNFSYIVFGAAKSAFLVAQIRNHFHLGQTLVCEMSRRIHFGYTQSQDNQENEQDEQDLFERMEEVSAECSIQKQSNSATAQTTFAQSTEHLLRLKKLPRDDEKAAESAANSASIDPNHIHGFWFKPTSKYYHLDRKIEDWDKSTQGSENDYIRINICNGARRN
jgi:RNA recognition motif-containing protein